MCELVFNKVFSQSFFLAIKEKEKKVRFYLWVFSLGVLCQCLLNFVCLWPPALILYVQFLGSAFSSFLRKCEQKIVACTAGLHPMMSLFACEGVRVVCMSGACSGRCSCKETSKLSW